jgi:Zn ribbon nucleic-acid-binding protein
MRYRYAKYGYYIPESELTIETYCPSCQSESKMTISGDGAIQLQCNRCSYNARYDDHESLRRCSRVRERAAIRDLNHYCKYRFEAAEIMFAIYTRELARVLGVAARPKAVRRVYEATQPLWVLGN